MQITDVLAQMGGLKSVARELGVSEDQATSSPDALVPAILGGFKRQAQSQPAGIEGLGGLLGQLGGGGLLDNVLAPQPTDVSRGNDVLGQIFGSKDVSRAVAQDAAARCTLVSAPAIAQTPPPTTKSDSPPPAAAPAPVPAPAASASGRVMDLSRAAARKLAMPRAGLVPVKLEVVAEAPARKAKK